MSTYAASDLPSFLLAMGGNALAIAVLRYALVAAPTFVLGYLLLRRVLATRRIQDGGPHAGQLVREIGLSLGSSAVFAAIDVWVVLLSLQGSMQLRIFDPAPAPLRMAATVAMLVVLHDAYFYWTHRLLHGKRLYRSIHHLHHRSTSPTPFAAFAFHPIEAAIQYGFVPLIAWIVPLHVTELLVFGIVMTLANAYGHGGIELSPRRFVHWPLLRYLLTPTHHDLHHSSVSWNYGFYSSAWDRLMGTNHPDYEAAFDAVVDVARRREPEADRDRARPRSPSPHVRSVERPGAPQPAAATRALRSNP